MIMKTLTELKSTLADWLANDLRLGADMATFTACVDMIRIADDSKTVEEFITSTKKYNRTVVLWDGRGSQWNDNYTKACQSIINGLA